MSRLALMARISRALQFGEATPQQRADLQEAFNQADGDQLPADADALLEKLEQSEATEQRAQKHDIAEEGHDYWVHGKGLAKWADTDDPWTELHAHLVKFMPDGDAKRTAAEWFHEVFHFWPGSDANRVTHGHPPRGKKVGPG